jgi:peptide/nickel transport system permease protein
MLFGMFFGIISAVWRNSPIDYLVRFIAIIGVSFPVFLLALVGLTLLHKEWGLVAGPRRLDARMVTPPTVTGMYTIDSLIDGDLDTFRNAVSHLVLPAMVLVMYTVGIISRVTRSAMLEVLNMDYVRTARAKGLNEKVVIIRHTLANAMIPIVTILGLSYANLLVGSILIESIFAWQGIGFYMFRASTSQDFPAIMGVSLLIAIIYVGVNFIVDILYYFLDPRIRTA